jgi:hypothetical protein
MCEVGEEGCRIAGIPSSNPRLMDATNGGVVSGVETGFE